ncbi:DUF1499 domain-containing protein [Pedosphaera parvula]|uniref:DUF1499 domain-containing protein n=1 Tax=Pedosphaera parvula (strain Ellin514) TaxID=320771 RepID=B9XFH5_PEDPL|nr:DUF1499 domain-containing protein [Pedosphaera parvula]EEF61339.1 protein of unknown function DUF1499 [Pedosphaera parvula Ellin514]
MSSSSSQLKPVGLIDGKLRPCPDSPNCACSQNADQQHLIEPFQFNGSRSEAWSRLKQALLTQKRVTIITDSSNYLHLEFRSVILRFVDDVEFLLAENVIHVRSASRVGYSDLGVNRRRLETIRRAFNQLNL